MDDLLDLSWSDSPASAAKPSGGPSMASLLQPAPARPGSSASSSFDALARPGGSGGPNYSSYNNSRTASPLPPAAARPLGSGINTPRSGGISPAPPRSPAPISAAANGGSDAFSSLLGLGGAGGATSQTQKNLSMAERSAQLAAERKKAADDEKSRWDLGHFDLGGAKPAAPGSPLKPVAAAAPTLHAPIARPPTVLASPSAVRSTPSPAPAASGPRAGSFWDNPTMQPVRTASAISKPATASPTSSNGKTNLNKRTGARARNDLDAFDDFLNPALAQQKSKASTPARAVDDPWDLDAFASAVPAAPAAHVTTDYGNDYASEDDDLLGDLGRSPKPKAPTPQRSSASPPARAGAVSPPPHILGQIVEMGFSPAQARAALAATTTGLDVQAALESLLGEGSNSRNRSPAPRDHGRGAGHGRDDLDMDDEQIAREMQAREDRRAEDQRRARHAARRAGPSREAVRRDDPAGGGATDDFGEQADRIMAQASEIGASMLSKATSFWNTGKERAMKAYEEQKRAMDAQAGPKKRVPTDGRPRWMVEAEETEAAAACGRPAARERERDEPRRNGNGGGFRDDYDDDHHAPASPQKPRAARPQPAAHPQAAAAPAGTGSLFDDAPHRPYVSKNRHLKKPVSGSGAGSPAAAPTPRRPATPLVTRTLVSATAAQVSAAAQHKTLGNDHFKLGRYAEADTAYTKAIGALPAGHLHLVTLHNNRAATRLKLGESGTATADCTAAIALIGPTYHPSKEAPLPADHQDVKLGDALVKATVKRAQAHEMGEKWKLALEDWERVLGFNASMGGTVAASKTQASEGVRRAKRALDPKPAAVAAAPPKPRAAAASAPTRPAKPVDVSASAAVSEMRAAAAVAAAEDVERAHLKDAVDARIEGWKKGKETNLRALIASLDTVLWDDILAGGLKVGMHELVTEKQVKIKYMKVVARLHPDKLQVSKTTVEQRMLASGAFGVLSEAWAAFNA